jgi:hypothetical protein
LGICGLEASGAKFRQQAEPMESKVFAPAPILMAGYGAAFRIKSSLIFCKISC